ncbi:hypothetical protein PYW07_011615 [Mythimna separata]|uniref:Uncharacterized protein n=1 Tax=Mythimna separata TaxID=271217 RepID=A0AAD7Y6U8_MYTSE|nr:hypothetical protein PYW07_011615 [Mythimna separata]
MLFINFLCLLYLMVLADSHTISKSIYNDYKVDNNIIESIHDVDRQAKPNTRRERQHRFKLYCNKDEHVLQPNSLKETKPYGLNKATDKITLKAVKVTTEHAKPHKTPKRRICFWKKFRGKDKKKETNKHDPNGRKRRIPINKKEHKNTCHLATKDSRNHGPKTKGKRKNKKMFSPRQPELRVSKRDAGTLFSTRPYSSTPQSYKLQMGIAPQVDNMLKSKYKMQHAPPFTVVNAHSEVTDNLRGELESMTSRLSLLKEKYGVYGIRPSVKTELRPEASMHNTEASSKMPHTTKTQQVYTAPDEDFQLTGKLEAILNNMKSRTMQMAAYDIPVLTELIKSSAMEATYNYDNHEYGRLIKPDMPAPRNSLSTYVAINDIQNVEKRTPETTKSDEYNLNDSIFSANTESHYIAARSIKEDTMTIAQNVEDMLQRELKNLYNKVKHKVSNDLRKEVHTVKSTLKESYSKFSGKLSSKCKAAANSTTPSSSKSTKPTKPKSKTCACTTSTTQKNKLKSLTTLTTASTSLRVKKKDDKDDNNKIIIAENFTPDLLFAKTTYDDYMMLTVYEQMLAKTHDDNLRKMLATSESQMFPKIKRQAVRLSKRNPETLTDVKLKEVIQSIYDDGNNIPDYDYIDPAANVTSTGKTTAVNYNEFDYNEGIDSSDSSDNSAQDPLLEPTEAKNKVKGAAPAEGDTTQAHTPAADSRNTDTISDTSYEGLSNKISYNEFVNGYKHYLKFQEDQGNQNFSNLVKYQAHRHHSVDDIGKYILSKIPPLPPYNKMKREVIFSDDSDNNMDYQEITTKSDDSWFKKHFYLFIDNGPPKKYHTSETVELKPTEPKLYVTEPTSRIGQTEQLFVKVEPNGFPRKPKEARGPPGNLDDLSKVLDSIKKQQTDNQLSQANSKTEKDPAMPLNDNINATGDAAQPKSFINKLFACKRRSAPKKDPITMMYFPTTPNYMFTESLQGRLRRTAMKVNFETTMMADFINKEILEKASTGAKDLFVDTSQLGNKETNKYGYVDIDLVPRQTAVVKLRDAKKSRFKNFFKKFHFRKKNKKDGKPKRSCYYNSQNRRRERFNPIKKLKAIFSMKEVKDKEEAITEKLPDYDIANTQLEPFKPVKFEKHLSVDEMQKLVPNISDTYFEPPPPERTTKDVSELFGLDSKDEDLLSNFHPSSSSIKQTMTTQTRTVSPFSSFSNGTLVLPTVALASKSRPSARKKPQILRVPACNVMTVNVKTIALSPTTTLAATEPTSKLTIDDMSLILNKMQDKIQKNQEQFPKLNTMYTPSSISETKYEYKKNIGKPRSHSQNSGEVVIKSKMTRVAKFPIKERRNKMIRHDDSETINIGEDYSNIYGPSILEYIHELGNRNAPYESRKQAKVNIYRKSHNYHLPTPAGNSKNKDRYTDYFNDLLMWHNDILNLDSVPNPQWENILRTLHPDSGNSYTTPDMKKLMIELNEINEVMDPGRRLNKTVQIFPNGSLNEGSRDRVGVRALQDKSKGQGVIKSMAIQDNTLVTSKDMIIRGEVKYYQYNKPHSHENKIAPGDVLTKLNRLKNIDTEESVAPFKWKGQRRSSPPTYENYPEPAIIVDTTLMAYDDDVDSVTRDLEPKKKAKMFYKGKARNKMETGLKQNKKTISVDTAKQLHMPNKVEPMNKLDHPTLLKTNSAPMQYYTTPLPMKAKDFNKFLKDNEMDVDFVTSPILELPTIKDWANNNGFKQSAIATSKEGVQLAPSAKDAKPAMKVAVSAIQEAAPPMLEAMRTMQDAAPPKQGPTSPTQGEVPPMQQAAPDMQGAAPSMQGAAPPMQQAAPAMHEAVPCMPGAAPPVQEAAPAMQGVAPPMHEAAPPMQGAAPRMQEMAPPMQEAAPPAAPAANKNSFSWTNPIATRPPIAKLTETTYDKKSKAQAKTTKKLGFSQQIKSKVESFTKALGKSVKFTPDHPKVKAKEHKLANLSTSKPPAFWDDDFERYKRYSEVKLLRNTAEPPQGAEEANYYNIFKKKMKERLFEKKATATAPVDPASIPSDPQNKEVEITIINFDDIEKITSQLPFETFAIPAPRRDEVGTYTDLADLSNMIKTKSKTITTPKPIELTQKEDNMHNELLYKDIFNEHANEANTKKYFSEDKIKVTKTTDYVNSISNEEPTSGDGDKMRFPFEKMPMYPNILSKVPTHRKNFNSIPKRVHISSHHYKYDIFYDDLKSTRKTAGVEGFQPKLVKITTNDLGSTKLTPKGTPAKKKQKQESKQLKISLKKRTGSGTEGELGAQPHPIKSASISPFEDANRSLLED